MKQLLLLVFTTCIFSLSAQSIDSLNIKKVGQWDDNTLPTRSGLVYNDCWGYTAPDGKEYAILGSVQKVHFFNITDPTNPIEIASFAGGGNSIWRDFKTYGHYAYAVADEGSEGLMIFDLSNLPTTVTLVNQTTAFFAKTHNIQIDENTGKLYTLGSNTINNGIGIIDIATDPENPTLLANQGLSPAGYVHDAFVRNDTIYCNHGNSDGMWVYDVSNPAAEVVLGNITSYSSQGYNHSCWLNDAGDKLVFCDETQNRNVKLVDVSDLTDITVTDYFKSTLEAPTATNSLAHNPFIKGDSVYISYYDDGVQVYDISDPNNAVKVAYYDTNPSNTNYSSNDGAWGVYPFFPSGTIIASDILNGLIVLEFYDPSAPLAVELANFDGKLVNGIAELTWRTYFENDHDKFIIEKSADGRAFEAIGEVKGIGNTDNESSYTFTDSNLREGINYYRLQILALDGSTEYTDVIEVALESASLFTLYPTIAAKGTEVTIANNGTNQQVELININGVIVDKWQMKESTTHLLSTKNLPRGTYFVRNTNQSITLLVQ